MKAVCSFVLFLVGACLPTQAQGTFALRNKVGSLGIDAPVLDGRGERLWGEAWRVELYGGPSTDSLRPTLAWEQSHTRDIISLQSPGYFTSGYSHAVVGVPGGGQAWVQVRVWSAELGATYEEAAALGLGGYGESVMLHLRASDFDAHELPASLVGLQSFSVRPIVPEPTTWALLVVGGLGLCWAKRRGRPLRRLQMDERPTPMHTS